jgi:hypothetical protein
MFKTTVDVRLDKRALDRELKDRDGAVGFVVAGFAGNVTKEIKGVFRERAGGAWWPVHSTVTRGTRGTHLRVTVKKSKEHRIVVKNASQLTFFWQREGRMFYGPSVNHPGSSPPENMIQSGIERASRRLTFTRAASRIRSE